MSGVTERSPRLHLPEMSELEEMPSLQRAKALEKPEERIAALSAIIRANRPVQEIVEALLIRATTFGKLFWIKHAVQDVGQAKADCTEALHLMETGEIEHSAWYSGLAHHWLGLLSENETETAQRHLKLALQFYNVATERYEVAHVHWRLGLVHYKLDQKEAAEDHFWRGLEICQPKEEALALEIRQSYADVLKSWGQYDLAREISPLRPDRQEEVRLAQVHTLRKEGKLQEAIALCEQNLLPQFAYWRAVIRSTKEEWRDQAIQDCLYVLDLQIKDHNRSRILEIVASLYEKAGNLRKTLECWERLQTREATIERSQKILKVRLDSIEATDKRQAVSIETLREQLDEYLNQYDYASAQTCAEQITQRGGKLSVSVAIRLWICAERYEEALKLCAKCQKSDQCYYQARLYLAWGEKAADEERKQKFHLARANCDAWLDLKPLDAWGWLCRKVPVLDIAAKACEKLRLPTERYQYLLKAYNEEPSQGRYDELKTLYQQLSKDPIGCPPAALPYRPTGQVPLCRIAIDSVDDLVEKDPKRALAMGRMVWEDRVRAHLKIGGPDNVKQAREILMRSCSFKGLPSWWSRLWGDVSSYDLRRQVTRRCLCAQLCIAEKNFDEAEAHFQEGAKLCHILLNLEEWDEKMISFGRCYVEFLYTHRKNYAAALDLVDSGLFWDRQEKDLCRLLIYFAQHKWDEALRICRDGHFGKYQEKARTIELDIYLLTEQYEKAHRSFSTKDVQRLSIVDDHFKKDLDAVWRLAPLPQLYFLNAFLQVYAPELGHHRYWHAKALQRRANVHRELGNHEQAVIDLEEADKVLQTVPNWFVSEREGIQCRLDRWKGKAS